MIGTIWTLAGEGKVFGKGVGNQVGGECMRRMIKQRAEVLHY